MRDLGTERGLRDSLLADLFYVPLCQLMRQQLLAFAMQTALEDGVDIVSVLHIGPAQNEAVKEVASPSHRVLGESATEVWA